jgi:hypothetical protein
MLEDCLPYQVYEQCMLVIDGVQQFVLVCGFTDYNVANSWVVSHSDNYNHYKICKNHFVNGRLVDDLAK